jgi:hypothetical protein
MIHTVISSGFTYAIGQFVLYQYSCNNTLMTVAKTTEICIRLIIYVKAYFISVYLLAHCIIANVPLMHGLGTN